MHHTPKTTANRAARLGLVSVAALSMVAVSMAGWFSTATATPAASCAACGHNLIRNPGAEAGKGTKDDKKVAVPHWKVTSNFTVASYAWSDGDLSHSTPGPKHHGKNYFGGPEGARTTTGRQLITVP